MDLNDRPNRFPWPPILLASAIAVGIILHKLVYVHWGFGPIQDIGGAFGFMMVLSGLFIDFLSLREMQRHKTTILPHRGASHLVTSGPYRISRNPVYVANVMILIGFGLVFKNIWLIALALPMAIAIHHLAIRPEEAHLEMKFGNHWRHYRKKVRRWL